MLYFQAVHERGTPRPHGVKTTGLAAGAVWTALFLLLSQSVNGFQVHINLNQMPGLLARNLSAWSTTRSRLDGIQGFGAPNYEDTMGTAGYKTITNLLRGKPMVHEQTWSAWTGLSNPLWNYTNSLSKLVTCCGMVATDVFLWDKEQPGSTLNVTQLDLVNSVDFPKVLLRANYFTPPLGTKTDPVLLNKTIAATKASINHPATEGIYLETIPYKLFRRPSADSFHMEIIKYTLALPKAVYIMLLPSLNGSTLVQAKWGPDVKKMVSELQIQMGELMCNSNFHLVPSNYGSNPGDLLPETKTDSWMNAVMYLSRNKC